MYEENRNITPQKAVEVMAKNGVKITEKKSGGIVGFYVFFS